MSAIDRYPRRLLGVITCPADFEIVYENATHRDIPIYEMAAAVDDELEFSAKKGDLLVGGGSGESAVLRISMPEAFEWLTTETMWADDGPERACHAFWTPEEAFVFGTGYVKLGWRPRTSLALWVTEHVVTFLGKNYPEFAPLLGPVPTGGDGSICRLPTAEDERTWIG